MTLKGPLLKCGDGFHLLLDTKGLQHMIGVNNDLQNIGSFKCAGYTEKQVIIIQGC